MTVSPLTPYYILYRAPRCIIYSTKKAAFGAKGIPAIAFQGTFGGKSKQKMFKLALSLKYLD